MKREILCAEKVLTHTPVQNMQMLFLAAIMFLMFGYLSQVQAAPQFATLDKVSGEVVVLKSDGSALENGKDGMLVKPGQIVKTSGPDAVTDVVLFDGSRVRLLPSSEVRFSVKKKEEKHNIQIDLIAGKIFNVVQKNKKSGHYVVKTSSSVAGFKGRVFSAERSNEQSVFMVQDGKLKVINPHEKNREAVYVTSMNKTTTQAIQAPSASTPLSAEEIAMFDILNDIAIDIKIDIQSETESVIREDTSVPGALE
jgi:hypothetical protein